MVKYTKKVSKIQFIIEATFDICIKKKIKKFCKYKYKTIRTSIGVVVN